MQHWRAAAGVGGGSSSVMEWYAVAGISTITALIGLVAFRLAKDEWLLRRKRLIIDKY
ncbi:MAG: hypothetical protein M3258_08285 [Thermoproteota archaeon]|nr:hypothetical protein [Thermoproteota archaeon]